MNDNQVKTCKFLEFCYEIENSAAQIYYFYAECFGNNPAISELWTKIALEEDNHAAQVLLAKKLTKSDTFQIHIDPWMAENTSKQIQILYKKILESPPTLIDALRSSIKMEHRFAQFHAENALLFEDVSMHSFFVAITEFDCKHTETLEIALKEIMAKPGLNAA